MKRAVNTQMPAAKLPSNPMQPPSDGIPWMKPIPFNPVLNQASNNPGPETAPGSDGAPIRRDANVTGKRAWD